MKKTRRRYDQEIKISVLAESDKSLAHITRSTASIPVFPVGGETSWTKSQRAFSGNGNRCKYEARIAGWRSSWNSMDGTSTNRKETACSGSVTNFL
jgi:hypothetical protein